jgi:hypothetical protein
MSIVTIEQLKSKFEGGDYPRSTDYINLIDTLAALPEAGAGGNVILNGSTAPASETGSNGDFILTPLTMIFMVQKLLVHGEAQHL